MVKKTLVLCCVPLISLLLVVAVSADTVTTSWGSIDSGAFLQTVFPRAYYKRSGSSSSTYFTFTPVSSVYTSAPSAVDAFPHLYSCSGSPASGTADFVRLSIIDTVTGSLFDLNRVRTLSFDVLFCATEIKVGTVGTTPSFNAKLYINGYAKQTVPMSYISFIDYNVGESGDSDFVHVMDSRAYKAHFDVSFSSPTDITDLVVDFLPVSSVSLSLSSNMFAYSYSDIRYSYISSTTEDVPNVGQQEDINSMQGDFDGKNSQAQDILDDMSVPDLSIGNVDVSIEGGSLVASTLDNVLDAVPRLKILLVFGLSLTVVGIVLYGIRGN